MPGAVRFEKKRVGKKNCGHIGHMIASKNGILSILGRRKPERGFAGVNPNRPNVIFVLFLFGDIKTPGAGIVRIWLGDQSGTFELFEFSEVIITLVPRKSGA